MRNSVVLILGLIVGIAVGAGAGWVTLYLPADREIGEEEVLKKLLEHSTVEISPDNNVCEGEPLKTVGDAMASLIAMNAKTVRNRLSYGCYNGVCTVSVSECLPWEESECSTRFLKVDLDSEGSIDASSFTCFDMP